MSTPIVRSKEKQETTIPAPCCKHCRYYLEDTETETEPDDDEEEEEGAPTTGLCRRYPPIILMAFPSATSVFPDVAGTTDWCGEFMPQS